MDISLDPAPINPDWILEGNPQARNKVAFKSEDGTAWTMIWECTRGRFLWFYTCDETVHIVEGDVVLTTAAGTIRLSAGSAFFFPAGNWAMWQVDSYVRKVAFLRHTLPRPAAVMLRGWKRIAERRVVQPIRASVRRGFAEVAGLAAERSRELRAGAGSAAVKFDPLPGSGIPDRLFSAVDDASGRS